MDILTIIFENSELILMVLSIVLALIARYFQTQATALREAAQAINDLSQTVLDSVKDGVVSKEELDAVLVRIEAAKKAIQNVLDIFAPPAPITEKLASLIVGYRTNRIMEAKYHVQSLKNARLLGLGKR
jgi:hypothetical protein